MNLQDSAAYYGRKIGIPLSLILAIAEVESNLDQYATRFEPGYRWLWNCQLNKPFRRLASVEVINSSSAPSDFPSPNDAGYNFYSNADTEWTAQRTSFGPLQLMGAVARERQYKGPLVALCCDVELSAKWAITHLSWLMNRYYDKHDYGGVISAYNAGRPRLTENGLFINQSYVNKVAKVEGKGLIPLRT